MKLMARKLPQITKLKGIKIVTEITMNTHSHLNNVTQKFVENGKRFLRGLTWDKFGKMPECRKREM